MKIGLLSMQRVDNYGSFWQAYCLKSMLEHKENKVEFIDIIPGEKETRTEYRPRFAWSKIKRIPYYLFQKKKHNIFVNVQKSILKCSDDKNYKADYDAVIIGSDEVFNFKQESPWGFSSQLYGAMDNDNVNTYAACFGNTTLDDIVNGGYRTTMVEALRNLQNISVRDQNSANIIRELMNIVPEIHLDPVLVGDLPLNKLIENNKEKYILVYSYDFRFSDAKIIEQMRQFAKEKHCMIYSVGFYQDWCDKNIVTDPLTLLSYFKNAEYVVTDTFHGSIFSVRCHKKFVTVIRESNKQKLGDLLTRLNMSDRIITDQQNLTEKLETEINYNDFELLRKYERERTENYLKRCLMKVE